MNKLLKFVIFLILLPFALKGLTFLIIGIYALLAPLLGGNQ